MVCEGNYFHATIHYIFEKKQKKKKQKCFQVFICDYHCVLSSAIKTKPYNKELKMKISFKNRGKNNFNPIKIRNSELTS